MCAYTALLNAKTLPVTRVIRSLTAAWKRRERRGKVDSRNTGLPLPGKPSGLLQVLASRGNSFQTSAPVWVFKLKSRCIFLAHNPHLSKTNLFFFFYSEYLKEYGTGKISYPTWKKIDLYASYHRHKTAVRLKKKKNPTQMKNQNSSTALRGYKKNVYIYKANDRFGGIICHTEGTEN